MNRLTKLRRAMFPRADDKAEQQALIMRALVGHPDGLTGYEISQYVDSLAAVPTTFGGLHALLDRLQSQGSIRRKPVATWRDAAGQERQRFRYVLASQGNRETG